MISERYAPMTYALFRIVFGFLFLCFGLQKMFGLFGGQVAPLMGADGGLNLQAIAGYIETICGLFIMVGLFTKPAAFLASGEMAVAYFYIHLRLMGAMPLVNMGERSTMFCFAFLYVATRGAGIWSLDSLMKSKKS
ncbi:MAG TPA: DoxX family protein [Vicinamibacterales bacterium]|nr:DoxX family protein [Vicinamibacterales bacterium]